MKKPIPSWLENFNTEVQQIIETFASDLLSSDPKIRASGWRLVNDLIAASRTLEKSGAPLPRTSKGCCRDCDHWEREVLTRGRLSSFGSCRKYAPALDAKGEAKWPITCFSGCCGDFRPRTALATPFWLQVYDPRTGAMRIL